MVEEVWGLARNNCDPPREGGGVEGGRGVRGGLEVVEVMVEVVRGGGRGG